MKVIVTFKSGKERVYEDVDHLVIERPIDEINPNQDEEISLMPRHEGMWHRPKRSNIDKIEIKFQGE